MLLLNNKLHSNNTSSPVHTSAGTNNYLCALLLTLHQTEKESVVTYTSY